MALGWRLFQTSNVYYTTYNLLGVWRLRVGKLLSLANG